MTYSLRLIKEKTDTALSKLLRNDLFLLENNSDEITVSHKLAEYLQQEFLDCHVDCEYNRDKRQVKKIDNEIARPDIIVHKRNTKANLLVVEIKKSNTYEDINLDKDRLKKFTSEEKKYKYRLGLFIMFYVGTEFRKPPDIVWYKKGKELIE